MISTSDAYAQAASQIIKEQQFIIGPLAYDQARKVDGLKVADNGEVSMSGDAKQILNNLVTRYSELFGQASVEVCRDAVKEMTLPLKAEDLPELLR